MIGVMPATFEKPASALLWTRLVWDPVEKAVRGEHSLSAVARLRPGVSVADAQSQLDIIAARLAQLYPADNTGWGAKVVPMREETVGDVRRPLLILLGGRSADARRSRFGRRWEPLVFKSCDSS